MTLTAPENVHVRVTTDGTCFIDDEFFAPPPGASINEAVLAHLRLEAAAMEMRVCAHIDDEQGAYQMTIMVNPDGTSQPLDDAGEPVGGPQPASVARPGLIDPIDSKRPWEPLPEPYSTRLSAICSTASSNRFDEAAHAADALLTELSQEFGPSHAFTLVVGVVRGEIAWLSGDLPFTVRSFSFISRAWRNIMGPQHHTTMRSAGNVVAAWRRMNDQEAATAGPEVIALLNELRIPGSQPALRLVEKRLAGLPHNVEMPTRRG
ncbi:hypothetical protein [Streptomyces hygroscopicus]|uniref:hypothetical protein n=1 Tax=Streptomyces hygroscopicus TaxID=1912 RepID=UPI001FCC4353|nr:hypothetical protein [Streptomyces hygroscopicus]BDH10466.1 hypothetical protein HOK021_16450 [Streptomyces hygroscopicus]